jgi:glycosyltransferase involved in cell wall biosynthesis
MQGIVVQCMAKMELGGAQIRIIELMRETGKNGYLITGKGGILYSKVKDEFKKRHIALKYLKREINPVYDLLCLFELRNALIKLHRRFGKVILHTHGSKAGVIGRIVSGSLPFCYSIHTVHGYPINPYVNPFKRFIYLNSERIASLFGDVIITQAKVHIERSKKWSIGKRNEFYHIPNFIKISDFKTEKREKSKDILIGTIGNLKPQKNPIIWAKVALKVTSKYPDVSFIYAGDGPLFEKVSKMTHSNNRIKLIGWIDDLPDLLPRIDIFFLPSRWEGMPRTVLEAMASSLPVVASNVDGTNEIVKESLTGFLVSPDDIEEYINKLEVLIKDKSLRIKMGKEGRERAKKYFNYKNQIKKTIGLYSKILNK